MTKTNEELTLMYNAVYQEHSYTTPGGFEICYIENFDGDVDVEDATEQWQEWNETEKVPSIPELIDECFLAPVPVVERLYNHEYVNFTPILF